jgi:7-keto-8-aminopelargonate synthetase-like enzyme
VGDAQLAQRIVDAAVEQGVFAEAVHAPVVPEGTARLRLAVMASHTRSELRNAAAALARAALRCGFRPGTRAPVAAAQELPRAA